MNWMKLFSEKGKNQCCQTWIFPKINPLGGLSAPAISVLYPAMVNKQTAPTELDSEIIGTMRTPHSGVLNFWKILSERVGEGKCSPKVGLNPSTEHPSDMLENLELEIQTLDTCGCISSQRDQSVKSSTFKILLRQFSGLEPI